MKVKRALVRLAIAAAVWLPLGSGPGPAHAGAVTPPQEYRLFSHPDGNAASPFYGLRLDGLLAGDDSNIFTFDFSHPDSIMLMRIDSTGITIHGVAFGGLDIGSEYDPSLSGLWDISFVYPIFDPDLTVRAFDPGDGVGSGTGTISARFDDIERSLVDYAGSNPFTFTLSEGHRLPEGDDRLVGRGWLNHGAASEHLAASDWLFIAELLPEPTVGGLLVLAVAGFAIRRSRARA